MKIFTYRAVIYYHLLNKLIHENIYKVLFQLSKVCSVGGPMLERDSQLYFFLVLEIYLTSFI